MTATPARQSPARATLQQSPAHACSSRSSSARNVVGVERPDVQRLERTAGRSGLEERRPGNADPLRSRLRRGELALDRRRVGLLEHAVGVDARTAAEAAEQAVRHPAAVLGALAREEPVDDVPERALLAGRERRAERRLGVRPDEGEAAEDDPHLPVRTYSSTIAGKASRAQIAQ